MPTLDLAKALDEGLHGAVLVFGSLPPRGRDLDLLAAEPEHSELTEILRALGYHQRGVQWARFRGSNVSAVELVPAERWGLPAQELAALFAEAVPLEGFANLLHPAPHHQLLILARRHARTESQLRRRSGAQGPLPARPPHHVDESLSQDPPAWRVAASRASLWHAEVALSRLHDAREGIPGGWRSRARIVSELARAAAANPELARRAASRITRRRTPLIVALSGLDGAGKSTQATNVRQVLEQLGIESEVVWPPAKNMLFGMNATVKDALHKVLAWTGRDDTAARDADARPAAPADDDLPEFPPLPAQRGAVAHTLAVIVALSQVLALRRARASSSRRSPQVLIYDRYVLDAVVYLRDRWGHGRRLRWQSVLIRLLARRPDAAYLLDLEPEDALFRKRDFPLENLRSRALLYRQLSRSLGVVRLDATRTPEELTEQIAREIWLALDQ